MIDRWVVLEVLRWVRFVGWLVMRPPMWLWPVVRRAGEMLVTVLAAALVGLVVVGMAWLAVTLT